MHDIMREPLCVKWYVNEYKIQIHSGLPINSYPKITIRIIFNKCCAISYMQRSLICEFLLMYNTKHSHINDNICSINEDIFCIIVIIFFFFWIISKIFVYNIIMFFNYATLIWYWYYYYYYYYYIILIIILLLLFKDA